MSRPPEVAAVIIALEPAIATEPLEGAGFEPSVPRDTPKFSTPAHVTRLTSCTRKKSARTRTDITRVPAAEPMVRIRLPPAESQQRTRCGTQSPTDPGGAAPAARALELGVGCNPLPTSVRRARRNRFWRRSSGSSKVWRRHQPVVMVFEAAHCNRCTYPQGRNGGDRAWMRSG